MLLTRQKQFSAASTSSTDALIDLMTRFESLGSACEFGLAQRICGAEPLGLFRFAGSKIENLCRVLENRLDGFLTDDDLAFEIRDREYMTYSRSYADFHTHTLAYTHRDHEPDVLARELKKASYLRRRFLSDWSQNQRIYVHSGCEDEASILRLFEILQQEAPCALLWVVAAGETGRHRQVEVLQPRLMKAYLSRYAMFHCGPRMDLPGWAQICFAAVAIARASSKKVPPPSFERLRPPMTWSRAPHGLVDNAPGLDRCRVLRERTGPIPVARATLSSDFAGETRIVFSVWIYLPGGFAGRRVTLRSGEDDVVSFGDADVTRLDEWQQMWLVMKVSSPTTGIDVTVHVEAAPGSEFFLAGAQVEDGPVPSEALEPKGAPIWPPAQPISAGRALRFARRLWRPPRDTAEVTEADRSSDALFLQGDALMRERCFEEADIVLSAGTILWPWKPDFYSHRGLCAEMSGDAGLAAERWRDLTRIFPHIAMGHHRLAGALRATGEIDAAVAIIENALSDHSNDPAFVVEAARVYGAASRRPAALALWDRVIAEHGECQDWLQERERVRQALASTAAASRRPVTRPSPAETPADPP